MIFAKDEPAPCHQDPDLFYSPEEDGRNEVGRVEREALAGMLCRQKCPRVTECLERALIRREMYGVWGGMGEGERRQFRAHLLREGYKRNEVPTGRELRSSVVAYYFVHETPDERFHPDLVEQAL
jgi:hypothetical protein